MAIRYVSWDTGNDTTGNGTSAATAWKTLTKALGATGIASGDTLYVAPGIYREQVTVAMTSPVAETFVIGDVAAEQFAGIVPPGEVRLTGWLTSDTAGAITSGSVLSLANRNFLTFRNIGIVAGAGSTALIGIGTGNNLKFEDCWIVNLRAAGSIFSHTTTAGAASAHTFDRCRVLNGTSGNVYIATATLHTADYDLSVLFRNCEVIYGNGSAFLVNTTAGSGTGKPGGIDFESCTAWGGGPFLNVSSAAYSATIPSVVRRCVVGTAGIAPLQAGTSGQIDSDENLWIGLSTLTNVTDGANSKNSTQVYPNLHFGQEHVWGAIGRPFLTPGSGSPALGGAANAGPSVDLLNRPRPAGGNSANTAIGALERHDTMTRDSTVSRTSGNAGKFTGPGDHEFKVPVDNISTTFTIYTIYDSDNYGAGTKPQMTLVADGEIGVTAQTDTATSAAGHATPATAATGDWEELSLTFTPTNPGIATIRLVSSAAAGGECWWDDFAAT